LIPCCRLSWLPANLSARKYRVVSYRKRGLCYHSRILQSARTCHSGIMSKAPSTPATVSSATSRTILSTKSKQIVHVQLVWLCRKTRSTMLQKPATKSTVASTLLLVWTRLKWLNGTSTEVILISLAVYYTEIHGYLRKHACRSSLFLLRNVRWPRRMVPPGESRALY